MNNSDRGVSNGIELLNRTLNKIAVLELYRVMWVGRLDEPDEDIEYQAVLRKCIPSGKRDPGGNDRPDESTVLVPRVFFETVFDAFRNDLFVLAQLSYQTPKPCISSAIMLPAPDFFDVVAYIQTHRQSVN